MLITENATSATRSEENTFRYDYYIKHSALTVTETLYRAFLTKPIPQAFLFPELKETK